jgi:hypothetical protein
VPGRLREIVASGEQVRQIRMRVTVRRPDSEGGAKSRFGAIGRSCLGPDGAQSVRGFRQIRIELSRFLQRTQSLGLPA